MMRVEYFVLFHDAGWMIRRHGRCYGPYASRQEAVREAVYVANYSITHGLEAEVIVQEDEPNKKSLGSYLVQTRPRRLRPAGNS
jgi:hypothetical protein